MKPKPFWELKNFTVPVAIVASLKRTNALDRTTIRARRYPDLACSWERPVVGRCKAGEISNAAHIGPVPPVCNDDLGDAHRKPSLLVRPRVRQFRQSPRRIVLPES